LDKAQACSLLEPLLRCPTAPYHEDIVADHVTSVLIGLGLRPSVDQFGNVFVRRPGKSGARARLGFMAHMDHPGFEVTEHRPGGVLAAWHGGVGEEYFPDAAVRFYHNGAEFAGRVDGYEIGAETGRVGTVSIQCDSVPPVGSLGMWDVTPVEFPKGFVRSRAIDDLAGCGVMLAMLTDLAGVSLDAEVWALFTRAEEVGFVGAVGLASSGRIAPSVPIVSIETSKAIPGGSQGMGPVIRLGDRSSVFDNGFLLAMRDIAAELKEEREGFKCQQLLMDGGSCEATALNAFGFRTAGLAIPLANYHNMKPLGPDGPYELHPEEINLSDFMGAVELCVALCERFPGLQAVNERHRRKLVDRTAERVARLSADQRNRNRSPR